MENQTIPNMPAHYLNDFKVYLIVDRDNKKHTILQHECNLRLIARYLTEKHQEFGPIAIRQFIAENKNIKDAGTIQGYLFTVRVFCEYLKYKGLLTMNWAKNIPLPRRMRKIPVILSVEEIEAILSVPVKYKRANHRQLWDTIFNVLALTGCRIGEALTSTVSSLDLKKGTWTIRETKTRTQRIVPLSPQLVKMLEPMTINKKPEDYIFWGHKAWRGQKPIHQTAIREELKRRVIAAGITKRVTPHTFRHSFITELFRQDISILKIAMLCGHEEIGTTQAYAKLVIEDLKLAILRHPIIAKTRNPYEILEHIKETIKKFRIDLDKRFFYELSEGNEGIRLNIFIR